MKLFLHLAALGARQGGVLRFAVGVSRCASWRSLPCSPCSPPPATVPSGRLLPLRMSVKRSRRNPGVVLERGMRSTGAHRPLVRAREVRRPAPHRVTHSTTRRPLSAAAIHNAEEPVPKWMLLALFALFSRPARAPRRGSPSTLEPRPCRKRPIRRLSNAKPLQRPLSQPRPRRNGRVSGHSRKLRVAWPASHAPCL